MTRPSLAKLHPHLARVGMDRSPNALTINFQKTIQANADSGSSLTEPLVNKSKAYTKYCREERADMNGQSPKMESGNHPAKIHVNLGDRLYIRKLLQKHKRWLIDVQFVLAMAGIVLMVVNTELTIDGVHEPWSLPSVTIHIMVSVTTVGLLLAIVAHYVTTVRIRQLDSGLGDWCLVTGYSDWACLGLELIVCSLHPIPVDISIPYLTIGREPKEVHLGAILSIAMLSRLYLACRFMVAHSYLLTDTSVQSFHSVSKVKIDSTFVFKSFMSTTPGCMIVGVMVTMFLVNTWAMRVCEVYFDPSNTFGGILNSMWVISMTFLTIGYGDIVPNSYCGRFVSALTGIMGVGTSALLIAVLSSKLQQTRSERHLHNFLQLLQQDRKRKHEAANVIKEAIRLWRMRRSRIYKIPFFASYSGKLVHAIQRMVDARNRCSIINENSVGLAEIGKSIFSIQSHCELREKFNGQLTSKIEELTQRIGAMESLLCDIKGVVSK